MSKIARYYVAENNPQSAFFVGVPQGDIDQATWDALPERIQRNVDAAPYYRKTAPPAPKEQKSTPADAAGDKE
jgi:hypothetical protein